jgi:hypothetical protein
VEVFLPAFGAYPNYRQIKISFFLAICKRFQKKGGGRKKGEKTDRQGLGLAYLMPDCWLEVSLDQEGPATDQLDQGFTWFSLVPEQMLSWYPNSTLHCMLHMQPSQ